MGKLLDLIVNGKTEYYDDIERMTRPESFEDRDEMNDHFIDCIGYTPDGYFHQKEVEEYYNEAVNRAPFSVQEQMRKKKSEIIDKTLEVIDEIDDAVVNTVFCSVCKSVVGWDGGEDLESLDTVINMNIYDESDYPEEDEDDEEYYDDSEDEYDDVEDDDE